ncbi:MAG: cobalamin B12-binding domain-containing protein [Rhodobacteraceae bacterium]|nr:cobalamin B12-binding domain-containing protein [Paracoccaceae bacterium]
MHDILAGKIAWRLTDEASSVRQLADEALAEVARRPIVAGTADPATTERLAHETLRAGANGGSVLALARSLGVGPLAMIDIYVGPVADWLGTAWCDDRLSFADVTRGCAVLHRVIGDVPCIFPPQARPQRAGAVLVVVPQGEDHILGAATAVHQLRRAGFSVAAGFCPPDDEVEAAAARPEFDAVLLSVASIDRLDRVSGLTRRIRARTPAPVLLGGAILGRIAPDALHDPGLPQIVPGGIATLLGSGAAILGAGRGGR